MEGECVGGEIKTWRIRLHKRPRRGFSGRPEKFCNRSADVASALGVVFIHVNKKCGLKISGGGGSLGRTYPS